MSSNCKILVLAKSCLVWAGYSDVAIILMALFWSNFKGVKYTAGALPQRRTQYCE